MHRTGGRISKSDHGVEVVALIHVLLKPCAVLRRLLGEFEEDKLELGSVCERFKQFKRGKMYCGVATVDANSNSVLK